MNRQTSFKTCCHGGLYLVPTPIGNLEDMTFRAVRILKEADAVFAEDTRQTRKLLTHFDISASLDSYHEHNKESKGQRIQQLLQQDKLVALVSDAGTPLVSDPGKDIVNQCIAKGYRVIALPGANAATTALTASGLGGGPFYFYGFLPRKKKERQRVLEQLTYIEAPIIFYESPYRIKETVYHLHDVWNDRKAVLARELTKKYEELFRGSLPELNNHLQQTAVKGECCLIVEGGTAKEKADEQWWENFTVYEHVDCYVKEGLSSKEAIKKTAIDRQIPKREVYAAYHQL
ncbi:16S rRNA (cytidine1402-2'-O)-methyltransferase [Alteribacillus persepolensis]|uniref:Ribosomal RNA small subunit methyltransferase I n=1 Tax=Alteribacillus persepolensis TaxID=568899 RepID=A0A1G8HY10_9BACI|nr:16S rRNA (cytidine(1402)-2'-O)-methyltransferase [Alteribacillus persepolensis]SDI11504.1 16S rRNA (cytidine1402-2'-O)-methyltransferase [Alteribacillus persepolensis]